MVIVFGVVVVVVVVFILVVVILRYFFSHSYRTLCLKTRQGVRDRLMELYETEEDMER